MSPALQVSATSVITAAAAAGLVLYSHESRHCLPAATGTALPTGRLSRTPRWSLLLLLLLVLPEAHVGLQYSHIPHLEEGTLT